MKLLNYILTVIMTAFQPSDMSLFGNRRRRKKMEKDVMPMYDKLISSKTDEIAAEKAKNPFESAGNKMAMAKASKSAKQMQTRNLNAMGGANNPEAMLTSQAATNEALGSAAGQIAVGGEAQKQDNINRLTASKDSLSSGKIGAATGIANSYGGLKIPLWQ